MGNASSDSFSFSAKDSEVDYYFMFEPKLPEILDKYAQLTGKASLLPEFALGLSAGTYNGGTWGHTKMSLSHYPVVCIVRFSFMMMTVKVEHSSWESPVPAELKTRRF